ncbi:MAG: ABC transporter permease [Bryobacterales bacterium]|nr:ABC transporter permease [Bryobacterales bacterium]
MTEFLRRLAYYFRRRQFERDLDEEMRHHAALSGASQFGNITRWKEESRAMWGWTFFEQLGQDLRYALRAIKNNRAFTALAVLSLALGIGANTAIFSFMDAILLRSLPVKDPESLAMVNWHMKGPPFGTGPEAITVVNGIEGDIYQEPGSGSTAAILPYPAFELLQTGSSPVFSNVFGFRTAGKLNLSVKGQADLGAGEYVSGDYFRGLDVPPAAGRLLIADDDRAGAPAVAVVSFALAQARFGGATNAAGSSILVNNVPFTVVGVAPPEFFGTEPGQAPDVYLPMHANLLLEDYPFGGPQAMYLDQNLYWIEIMARLRAGVGLAQAQAALAGPFHQWVASTATTDRQRADLPELRLVEGAGGLDALRRQYSKPLYVLLALVGFILAIACANIANLLLARATARRREMAVRLSMGAGRWRVVRQLLTESVLLASLGGILGLVVAEWSIHFLALLVDNTSVHASLDWRVMRMAGALSLFTGVLFGLAPALQSTRADIVPALKETRRAGRKNRWSAPLVAFQVALSFLILAAAGLFIRTLSNLQSVELGFNRENLLLFEVNARQAGHGDADIARFYLDLQKQFSAIPGVRAATLSHRPLLIVGTSRPVNVPGAPPDPSTRLLYVGPDFFTAMQIPLLAGREIGERDQAGSPGAAVVSERFAKKNFGDANPIGRRLVVGSEDPRDLEIVGIAKEAHYGGLKRQVPPVVYLPFNQGSQKIVAQMVYELRTSGDPLTYVTTVREIVHRADARVPVTNVTSQTAQLDRTIAQEIAFAKLGAVFAILALAIACVGLYGTLSYNVARRTNEIGIRMALGAQRTGVIGMILRDVVTMVLLGLAIGVPVALATSKFVSSFLYAMRPSDPLAITTAATAMLGAALLAGYAPARRASRIDPMTALRHE